MPLSPKMSKPVATKETALPSVGRNSRPFTAIFGSHFASIARPAPVADKLASLTLPYVETPALISPAPN